MDIADDDDGVTGSPVVQSRSRSCCRRENAVPDRRVSVAGGRREKEEKSGLKGSTSSASSPNPRRWLPFLRERASPTPCDAKATCTRKHTDEIHDVIRRSSDKTKTSDPAAMTRSDTLVHEKTPPREQPEISPRWTTRVCRCDALMRDARARQRAKSRGPCVRRGPRARYVVPVPNVVVSTLVVLPRGACSRRRAVPDWTSLGPWSREGRSRFTSASPASLHRDCVAL